MSISINTKYGKITISDKIIETAVADCCQTPELSDRIWLAQRPNISASYNDSKEVEMTFSVYTKFGQSIKAVCKVLADQIAELIYQRSGKYPAKITVNVAGVRSQNLVKRNMDVEFEYGNPE